MDTKSSLLSGLVVLVVTVGSIIWLHYSYDFFLLTVTCWCHCSCLIVPLFPCTCWAHTLSCHIKYWSFVDTGHAGVMWSIVLSYFWHSLHLLFLFSVFLLHDIWCLILCHCYFTFRFCFQVSSQLPEEHIFFVNKVSIYLPVYLSCTFPFLL